MGLRQGVKDFCKGLSVIFSKPNEGEGDRKLAKISLMVEEAVNPQTKHEIRRRVVKDVEQTLRSEAKKGGKEAVDRKVAISLATPEYVRMIHRLGLEESHIRVMAMEALKNAQ